LRHNFIPSPLLRSKTAISGTVARLAPSQLRHDYDDLAPRHRAKALRDYLSENFAEVLLLSAAKNPTA
jgi:hypothetical protein